MKKSLAVQIGKGTVCCVLFCLCAVLVFALFIKWFSLPSSVILPVDQIIKAVGIVLSCLVCIKEEKGIFKGAATGVCSVVCTYFVFSAIGESFSLAPVLLLELLFGGIVGGIGGVIAVNLRK